MFDIVIIGAGVIGGMVASALSKYETKICILEKESDVAMGATKANSGIVHAGFDAKEGSLKARLNVKGSEMMEEVCNRLGVKYINNESLVVGFEHEEEEIRALYERGIKNGVKGLSILTKEELHTIEKNLNKNLTCALLAKTGAIVNPYELCIASVGNAMDNSTELLLSFEVTEIIKSANGYTVSAKDGRVVEARYIINCAGLYADEIAKMTGINDIKITPRRGEYMLLDNECKNITQRTIFHTPTKLGKGILVSPTVDGNLLLGPTAVNIDDKTDKATTLEGYREITRKAEDNVSAVPIGKVITSFTGLRAVANTGDFIINERCNVITLAGIESPGLTASPAIAELVENMLLKSGAIYSLKDNFIKERRPFDFFRQMNAEEKNELISRDASYGRIVCRCEGITEGEILFALRGNPKAHDLDGVKRRTRSGMGRCQGGFCSPTIVELIAKELKIPFESVTKFGGKSILNFEKTKG